MIEERFRRNINDFEVCIFELSDDSQLPFLKDSITKKIQSMKTMNDFSSYVESFSVPTISPEFKNKFNERIKEISTPKENGIAWFDVRRSRVTEFMSQILLSNKYGCIFYDEADKRMNTTALEIDKHSEGIDVTGILNTNGSELKFVVCEVKASKDNNIPCSEAESLKKEIENARDDKDKRLSKEILYYIQQLNNVKDDILINKVAAFLINLLSDSSSQETLLKNVIFFPFFIRKNPSILETNNIDDFRDFNGFGDIDIKGVIWSFNEDITEFSKTLYNLALENK